MPSSLARNRRIAPAMGESPRNLPSWGVTQLRERSSSAFSRFLPIGVGRKPRKPGGVPISLGDKELRVIRGERIYLRSVERDDLERCHDWMNDEDLRSRLAQRYP